MKKLSKKDLLFAATLADKINPKSAAMAVYGGDNIEEKVKDTYELIRRPEFQYEMEKEHETQDLMWQIKRHHLAKRLSRLMDGDLRVLYDDDGNPKNPKDLSFEEQYLIKKLKSKTTYDIPSESFITTHEYELYDKITAMTRLESLFGLSFTKTVMQIENKEQDAFELMAQKMLEIKERMNEESEG